MERRPRKTALPPPPPPPGLLRRAPPPRRARALGLLRWRHLRRRDQALQLGDAGAAIGAGLELCADLGGRARACDDGVADGAAADAEAGADDRTGRSRALAGLARQQHTPLLVGDVVGDEQALHHIPVAGI